MQNFQRSLVEQIKQSKNPLHDFSELSIQNDLQNIEKIRLQEQIEFLQMRVDELENQLNTQRETQDQFTQNLQMQIQQLETLNNELISRMQNQKRSEEYLANANHHVTVLQKRMDSLTQENTNLLSKINQLSQQNQQLTIKWQKCSQSLRTSSNQKLRAKDLEEQLQKKSEELVALKEKYVSTTLELTVTKQSEQEYKNSVQNKIRQLVDQVKVLENQNSMLQNYLSQGSYVSQDCAQREDQDEVQQCEQCKFLIQELEKRQEQVDVINLAQLTKEQTINLKKEINVLQQRNSQLLEENQLLQQQILTYQESQQNEEQLVQSLSSTIPTKKLHISKLPEFINCQRSVDIYIKEPFARQHFNKQLEDLARVVEQTSNISQVQMMYDRLLIKYYQLIKNSSNFESIQKDSLDGTPQTYLSWSVNQEQGQINKKLQSNTPKKNSENTSVKKKVYNPQIYNK